MVQAQFENSRVIRAVLISVIAFILTAGYFLPFTHYANAQHVKTKDYSEYCTVFTRILGGSTLFEYWTDSKGNDIEVWCVQAMVTAHYEIKISHELDHTGNFVHHTIAGCFFPFGENDIHINGDTPPFEPFKTVTWINEGKGVLEQGPDKKLIFTYNFTSDNVTIEKWVGLVPLPPIEVRAEDLYYEKLEQLVEDPQVNYCNLDLSPSALGFSKTIGTLKIVVTDSNTGIPVLGAKVHLKSLEKGWDLFPTTNATGIVALPLDEGNYTVTALITGLNMTFSSSQTSPISFTKNKEIDLNLDSSILQTNATLTNGNLTSIELNKNSSSMKILVQTSSAIAGQLSLNLPRTLMDAKSNNTDSSFIVAVNGNQTSYTETKTSTERILFIEIPAGTKEIDVTGTQMVPEFSNAISFVFGISAVSLIIVYRIRPFPIF